jgi:hypothetical protein
MFLGRQERAMGEIADPNQKNAGSPHWHPTIQCVDLRQNVVGLWLKYGAKCRKNRAFFAPAKFVGSMRRLVDKNG